METRAPEVSVVIPTYHRPEGLRRCLDGLAVDLTDGSAGLSVEVLVVDNDPDAPTASAVAAAVERFRRNTQVPAHVLGERMRGSAYARNRGITTASGGVVAMLDDDGVPRPGWLAAVVAPVLAGAAAGAGGRVVLDSATQLPGWLDVTKVGGYLTAHDLGPAPRDLDYFADLVVTANAAWRRDVLLRVGGFDPAFGPRGAKQLVADDAHLTRQVLRLGERVMWCPDAVVVHDLPPDRLRLRWLLRRAWWQGRSDWRLERLELAGRRWRAAPAGVIQVAQWLAQELAARAREGLHRRSVAVHALLDVVRMAGRLAEIAVTTIGMSTVAAQPERASLSVGGRPSAGQE